MTPDVNVLVAASRGDHIHYLPAHGWLTSALASVQPARPQGNLSLLATVMASFLRLVTHPRVFVTPTPAEQAVAFVDAVLARPGVDVLGTGPEWPLLRRLCLDHRLAANDIPDAWIAASVLQHGEILVTFDRDFQKLLPAAHLQMLSVA